MQIRKTDDVLLYLWKAHNIINARLKGRNTEDPQFPKAQISSKLSMSAMQRSARQYV